MGIKYFYSWTRSEFPSIFSSELKQPLDILGLDLNGIFHQCVEELFPTRGTTSVLQVTKNKIPMLPSIIAKMPVALFRRICDKIVDICSRFTPRRYLLLCVDGVAGMAKCQQQRQRRFRSSLSSSGEDGGFDSNQLSPGTKLMDQLTNYIDWYLRKEMSEHPAFWNSFETLFSNEKVVGEGEHKLMEWTRQFAQTNDHVGIFSHDSDIFMLSLLVNIDGDLSMTMIRETDVYNPYEFVSLSGFREQLLDRLQWSSKHSPFHPKQGLLDFVGWSCWFGNDFMPCVPSLSLKEHMSIMIDMYRHHGSRHGHLFSRHRKLQPSFHRFVQEIAEHHEQRWIEERYQRQDVFFPDPLVLRHGKFEMPHFCLTNFDRLRQEYYQERVQVEDPIRVSLLYVEGMMWTLRYYMDGIKRQDWNWYYPYHYAPFFTDICRYRTNIPSSLVVRPSDDHLCPFLHLLMILPPSSKSLLPNCLQHLLPSSSSSSSPLASYFPDTFEIDVTGKNKEWEGTVLIPFPCLAVFQRVYQEFESNLSPSEKRFNMQERPFRYVQLPSRVQYTSTIGDISQCTVTTEIFE